METNQKEKDIAYAQGFLGGWAPKETIVKEWLGVLISGVDYYREKCEAINEDYQGLLVKFNQLTSMSAGYLQLIQEHKDLISQQKELINERADAAISDD